jgi:uncharacterized protein YbjT (DUF2867 family)
MKAVLIGSTGLVGSELLQNLLKSTEVISVISLSRKKLNLEHPKLVQLCAENLEYLLTREEILEEIKDSSHFFCALGSTIKKAGSKENFYKIDFTLVLHFAQLAKKVKAHLSVVSAKGASSSSSIFYNKVKGEMEEALIKLELSSLHIFRPGLLKGERSEFRLGELVALKVLDFINPILPAKFVSNVVTEVSVLSEVILSHALSPKVLERLEAPDIEIKK